METLRHRSPALRRPLVAVAVLAGAVVLGAPALTPAGGAPSPRATAPEGPSLSVTPSRLILDGATRASLQVTNRGRVARTISVAVGEYAISRRGEFRVDPTTTPARSAKRWLTVGPKRLTLGPGAAGTVTLTSRPPRASRPGDHHALLLLTSAARRSDGLAVRARIGVTTLVRVSGPLRRRVAVHRLTLAGRPGRRAFHLGVTNLGNVNERFEPRRAWVELRRGARVLARVPVTTRSVLPGSSGLLVFPYRGRVRGRVSAVARVRFAPAAEAGPRVTVVPPPVTRRRSARL